MQVLLQNATVIANCDDFMRQLLQNATFITNYDSTLSYFKHYCIFLMLMNT